MGNAETHDLKPVLTKDRRELDLSRKLTSSLYKKHLNNEYTEGCLMELPWSLVDAVSLYERLDFSFNFIASLPSELPLRVPHLRVLDLSHNQVVSLPESIGLLFHLEDLSLRHNFLKELPASFPLLAKLHKVDLSSNRLSTLPANLGDMEALVKLNVSNNKLRELPASLGVCKTLRVLLAARNQCIFPPQSVCDEGSTRTIRYLKKHSIMTNPCTQDQGNVFPRVRGNQVHSTVVNPESARVQYVQIQTQTLNTASRIKTPLLPPVGATSLQPDQLRDRIVGLLYGAVIGDVLGLCTEFLTLDDCEFHYDRTRLRYENCLRDEHRIHWKVGNWTSNSDILVLVLDSLLRWGGVVDELDVARSLVSWIEKGFPERGDKHGHTTSGVLNKVLRAEGYACDPHFVAKKLLTTEADGLCNGTSCQVSSVSADNACLPQAIILGIPRFHDLDEVASNSLRICQATHPDSVCLASAAALSVLVALSLQGKIGAGLEMSLEEALSICKQYGLNQLSDPEQKEAFSKSFSLPWGSVRLDEPASQRHPFTAVSASAAMLRTGQTFERGLTEIVMSTGHASMNGCVVGALLGSLGGYSRLPAHWISELGELQLSWLNSKINLLLDMMAIP